MKFRNVLLPVLLFTLPLCIAAQTQRGLTGFPEFVTLDIPGAPRLGKPMLITGTDSEVIGQGHGLAAPAFWDWNGDGTKDLLIGEFGSGLEFGKSFGNFVRVYQNIGTETQPEFDGKFQYARPPFRFPGNGTPLSVDQFCCIGFAPQFIDLNADGYPDMITGQYQGEVSWFRGSEEGFLPGEALSQDGNPRDPDSMSFQQNQSYWFYSSASIGDFTNDGLIDLIIGGTSLRISKNTGKANEPSFAERELLLDIAGNPLKVYDYSPEELKTKQELETQSRGIIPVPVAGDDHLSPYVVDWDNDGVLDLLVTNFYNHQGLDVVTFYKGVKQNSEHRFHPGIPLFTAKDKSKAFPGSGPRIFVTDWNNDGVNDLLIGASVATMNGTFSDMLSWNWEKDMELHGAGKDPALMMSLSQQQLESYKTQVKLPGGITIEDYFTIRHQGYVYVMLGSLTNASDKVKTKAGSKAELKAVKTKKSKTK